MAKKSVVPEGYQSVTPYLRVRGAAEAIAYYGAAFGARERFRLVMGDRIGHAEIEIGGTTIMLSDEFPEKGIHGPRSLLGTTCALSIYVADADAVFAAAVAAGGRARRQPTDEFYGDRTAQIEDPFGHLWSIQQRIEEVAPTEMQRRLDALMSGAPPAMAPSDEAKAETGDVDRPTPAAAKSLTPAPRAKATVKGAKTRTAPAQPASKARAAKAAPPKRK